MPEHYSRIFLLSHMRALTSLAGHILGSHPEINGYYEMHISYEEASALDTQREALEEGDGLKANSRYLFDKLLHDDYRLRPERPGLPDKETPDIKILVSLREPAHTIKSIVNLFAQKQTGELYASPVEAAKYYVERISTLADFCRTSDHPYYYFDAEMLQTGSERLLLAVSRWLELVTPLSDRYDIFRHTGEASKGDTSKRIQRGTISQTTNDYSHIHITEEALATAQQVYRECRQQIIDHAADSVVI